MRNSNNSANIELILDEYKNIHEIDVKKMGFSWMRWSAISYIRTIDTYSDKYDMVLLVSGLGHQHMNQLKTLFKALNEIILEPFGKVVLNFRLAYCYFVNASDTYKSFKALEVLLHGITSEIYHEFSNFVIWLKQIPLLKSLLIRICTND